MRLLLINNNPAVSKLINLSAEKLGYEIEEISNNSVDLEQSFNITVADSDSVEKNSFLLLMESGNLGKIIYIGSRGVDKPEFADYFLQKPFLPADFVELLKEVDADSGPEVNIQSYSDDNIDDFSLNDLYKEDETLELDDLDILADTDDDSIKSENEDDFILEKRETDIDEDEDYFIQEKAEVDENEDDFIQEKVETEIDEDEDYFILENTETHTDENEDTFEHQAFEEIQDKVIGALEDKELNISKEQDESADLNTLSILDSDEVNQVKELLEDEEVPAEDFKEERDDYFHDLEFDTKTEDEKPELLDVTSEDELRVDKDFIQTHTTTEFNNENIENLNFTLDEESGATKDAEIEEKELKYEEFMEAEDVATKEKKSYKDDVDNLENEDMLGVLEEDFISDKQSYDEIAQSLQSSIANDLEKMLDKDTLKGLKINISISFDEVQTH